MPRFPEERPSVWNFHPKAGPTFMAIWMWVLVVVLSVAAIALAVKISQVHQ